MYKGIIIPLFYLGPLEFFSKLKEHSTKTILIEKQEHFPKQTYRNRAQIYASQGKLDLIVPVVKGSKVHSKVKDVKISYDFNWQRLHWLSLQASYRRSAYFEYYEDDFAPFYSDKPVYLFDYNQALFELILKLLKMPLTYSFTDTYKEDYEQFEDARTTIHPKQQSPYQSKPYFQLFEDRQGFLNNLSILDLLFNQGPQSLSFL